MHTFSSKPKPCDVNGQQRCNDQTQVNPTKQLYRSCS